MTFGLLLIVLALVAFVAFTTALLAAKLVYSEPSVGCTGHHYGDYEDTGGYAVERHSDGRFSPVAKRRATCQHTGCRTANTVWERVGGTFESESEAYERLAEYTDES